MSSYYAIQTRYGGLYDGLPERLPTVIDTAMTFVEAALELKEHTNTAWRALDSLKVPLHSCEAHIEVFYDEHASEVAEEWATATPDERAHATIKPVANRRVIFDHNGFGSLIEDEHDGQRPHSRTN